MPWFERGNVRLYYEDVGQGEPIITNHGLSEDSGYWSETGITAKLAEQYRVISMDMRGHGRTVVDGQPYGFDVGTMGNDFGALADYLGLDRFHILCHATGGMAAVRYAMTASKRLLSLMLTDTGSATAPDMPGQEGQVQDLEAQREAFIMGAETRKTVSVEDLMTYIKAEPGPFLFKMAEHPESKRMWGIYEGFLRRSDPVAVGNFMLSFYADQDPMIEGLRQISCPTLVLLGEFDLVFLGPSDILAREIPDNKHVILNGVGHMTAIEDPERTTNEILDFLKIVAETGKAQRKG
ncbi:MAG: alpha/beta hydrolase [Thermodesulfobacteriota bacterium]|jgi:pimeloyl-ACP methyl ester carboxylesterase